MPPGCARATSTPVGALRVRRRLHPRQPAGRGRHGGRARRVPAGVRHPEARCCLRDQGDRGGGRHGVAARHQQGPHQDSGKRRGGAESFNQVVIFRRRPTRLEDPQLHVRCRQGSGPAEVKRCPTNATPSSWATAATPSIASGRSPAGEGFGFLSDLMVDGEGRVHVAQRGTDQPVLVFDRDGRLVGAWGEGTLAEPHYINGAPDGSILVADRDAHQVLRFDQQARSCRRWASGTGRRSTRRSTIRPRRRRRPTARSMSPTATAIPASIASRRTAR